jgi:hypothetical protein
MPLPEVAMEKMRTGGWRGGEKKREEAGRAEDSSARLDVGVSNGRQLPPLQNCLSPAQLCTSSPPLPELCLPGVQALSGKGGMGMQPVFPAAVPRVPRAAKLLHQARVGSDAPGFVGSSLVSSAISHLTWNEDPGSLLGMSPSALPPPF